MGFDTTSSKYQKRLEELQFEGKLCNCCQEEMPTNYLPSQVSHYGKMMNVIAYLCDLCFMKAIDAAKLKNANSPEMQRKKEKKQHTRMKSAGGPFIRSNQMSRRKKRPRKRAQRKNH